MTDLANNRPTNNDSAQTLPEHNFFAVVPAAGIGQRMAASVPKQYLPLLGKTVMELTLAKLLAEPLLQTIVVAIGSDDDRWQSLNIMANSRIQVVEGGVQRCHSVLNGLHSLAAIAKPDDWILVHDVARPCIANTDIKALITCLENHTVGGILAVPVSDTIKKLDNEGVIAATVDRSQLWQAQTPQMFRYQLLLTALDDGIKQQRLITDEASAVELAGFKPAIVEASQVNIKITRPGDLQLAEYYLQQEH